MSTQRWQRTYLAIALILILAVGTVGYFWLGRATPAAATSLFATERQRIGFGGIIHQYGSIDSYPSSVAQLNAGWYTDYWWSPNPPQPNGIEYAQLIYIENFGWTRYQPTDGLAHKIVYAIATEGANHIWFGTADGVSELNNGTWTTYKTANGLVNNVVRAIAIDASGNKWFGTDGGVSKFDGSAWTTYTRATTANKLLSNTIYAIAADGNDIWIATAGGVNRLSGTTWTSFTNANTSGGLLSNTVLAVAIDGTTKWFGTTAGVSKLSGSTWTGYTTANGLAGNRVQAIAIDGATKWFGTSNGVSSLEGTSWTTYRMANTNGLLSNDVRAMAMDGDGNLWCGTMGGVNKYDGDMWSGYPAFDSRDTVNLASNWVYAVAIDQGGRKWFGTDSGGASVFDDAWAWSRLASTLAAKPGSVIMIGNEPDSSQDVCIPPIYAQRYHEFYTFIKSHDPTAQVAVAGITQATPLRMQWLNDMVEAYEDRYGEFIPVDIWNTHEQILKEDYDGQGCRVPMNPVTAHHLYGVWVTDTTDLPLYCKNGSGEVEYCQYDAAGEVAVGQTQIRNNTDYDGSSPYYTWQNASFDLFKEHVLRYRSWMKAHGQQDKPLIITEYGVMMPDEYLLPPTQQTALQFMRDTFDYMLGYTDEALGCPSDGYRLVQRWLWFSLNSRPYDIASKQGYNGSLVYDDQWDTQGRNDALTPFGQIFAEYTHNPLPQIADATFSGRSVQPGQTFLINASFEDAGGVGQLDDVFALLNTGPVQVDGIYLRYDPDGNLMYMRNLADSAWMGGFSPGTANVANSSYATLLGQQSSAQVVGNTLNVTWAISLKAPKLNQL